MVVERIGNQGCNHGCIKWSLGPYMLQGFKNFCVGSMQLTHRITHMYARAYMVNIKFLKCIYIDRNDQHT